MAACKTVKKATGGAIPPELVAAIVAKAKGAKRKPVNPILGVPPSGVSPTGVAPSGLVPSAMKKGGKAKSRLLKGKK